MTIVMPIHDRVALWRSVLRLCMACGAVDDNALRKDRHWAG